MHVEERAPRWIDLHQGFSSLPSRSGDAHTFKRFGPQLANLGVTSSKGGADGIAERHEVRAFQQHDLGLQLAAALEFDAAQRHGEGVVGIDLRRQ